MSSNFVLIFLLLWSAASYSQSSIDSIFTRINPDKLSATVERKLSAIQEKFIFKSTRALQRLRRQEERIYEKQLATKDSSRARSELAEIQNKYKVFEEKLNNPCSIPSTNIRLYIPHLDSLRSAIKFLDQNIARATFRGCVLKIESFNGRLQQAQEIKDFIHERNEVLRHELERLASIKRLKKYNKEFYYYAKQINEYKDIISDPRKIEKKTLELIGKTKIFQDFMHANSMLASLFPLSADPSNAAYTGRPGFQTKEQVNKLIHDQLSGCENGLTQFEQNVQQAHSQLNQLKEKMVKIFPLGDGGRSDNIIPEGFKANNQKRRSLLKRLEYGTNIQAQKATNFFPATVDLGLSLGYKLNDNSTIGLGVSYKIGLGHGWNNMELSSQGAGLRSYLDLKLKGSTWISGGYEMNYKGQLKGIQIPSLFTSGREESAWQQSGLVGLSKVIDVKSKFFKKTKLQLLWDILSYQQIPRTQPIIFRVGYSLN